MSDVLSSKMRLLALVSFICLTLSNIISATKSQKLEQIQLPLLDLEKQLVNNLEQYADALRARVRTIRLALQMMQLEQEKSHHSHKLYLSNPLNALKMIRHSSEDYVKWLNMMQSPVGQAQIDYMRQLRLQLSTHEHLENAASMAVNSTDHTDKGYELTTLDCFELGMHRYRSQNFFEAQNWFRYALQQYNYGSTQEATLNVLQTAFADLVLLQGLDEKLITILNHYAEVLEEKVELIDNALIEMQDVLYKSAEDPVAYLTNQLHNYRLIRHMHQDWKHWECYMEQSVGKEAQEQLKSLQAELPNSSTLQETIAAIVDLQHIYDLDSYDMAHGILNGIQYDAELTPMECYAMGMHYYEESDYHVAASWFRAGIILYVNTQHYSVVYEQLGLRLEVLYLMYASTLYKQHYFEEAINVVEEGLDLSEFNTELLRLKFELLFEIKVNVLQPIMPIKAEPTDHQLACRGHLMVKSKLYCNYNTTATPFAILAPFKTEILQFDPFIVLYHDVIDEHEILEIVNPIFNHAGMKDVPINEDELLAQHLIVSSHKSIIGKRLITRITDMTALSTKHSNDLYVVNSGIVDDGERILLRRDLNNSIARVLIYLNNVPQGGASVFPETSITVFPKKGSALVWYHTSQVSKQQPASSIKHVACPVLFGSKWIAGKIIFDPDSI